MWLVCVRGKGKGKKFKPAAASCFGRTSIATGPPPLQMATSDAELKEIGKEAFEVIEEQEHQRQRIGREAFEILEHAAVCHEKTRPTQTHLVQVVRVAGTHGFIEEDAPQLQPQPRIHPKHNHATHHSHRATHRHAPHAF
ncbi:hypothetical protein ACLOJK_026283 [Asimina triloba]